MSLPTALTFLDGFCPKCRGDFAIIGDVHGVKIAVYFKAQYWFMMIDLGGSDFPVDSGFARTTPIGSRYRNTFTWYEVCDAPRRPGRASKRGEFPGAGHYRRHRSRFQWARTIPRSL